MTVKPATLKALAHYWVAQGGVNLGIVGDTRHKARGTSYHLGKDDLIAGAYSARTARDKAGLKDAASANAASAIDLGRLDESLHSLWQFSRWFAQRCFNRDPAYKDVREVIFWSVVRQRVIGWSALAPDKWINDYGDASHKTHTHISFYRDSMVHDKRPMFRPYFTAAGGVEMGYPVPKEPSIGDVVKNSVLYTTLPINATDPARKIIDSPPTPRIMPWHGTPAPGFEVVEYVDDQGVHSGRTYYMKSAELVNRRPVFPAPGPPDAAACVPFTDPLNETIAQLRTEVPDAEPGH